jgi:hypothetical protein
MSTTGETGQTPRSAASRGTNSSDGGSGGPSVYLSYRPEDETYARRLSKDLGQRLIAGTVVNEVAGSGDRWEQQIRAALESADVLLLLLGPTYLGGGSLSSSQTYEIASVRWALRLWHRSLVAVVSAW